MIIKRVLTNNAVVIESEGNEKIVCGKGIAFKKKPGMKLDESLVNQVFILEENVSTNFEDLVKDVPLEYVEIANELITLAKLQFARDFPDSIILTLSDHLYSAATRLSGGLEIHNSLLWDIQNFYEIEFEIGKKGIQLIKERLNITFPDDEAGFIALHLVNAQLDDSNMDSAYKITKVIQEICTIVRHFFSVQFDTKNVYYYRFITHLKFFSLRLFKNKQIEDEENELLEVVKTKFASAYSCVLKISDFIQNKYDYGLSNEEKLYLTIHIHRVVTKAKEK